MDERGRALKGSKRKFSIPGQFAPRLIEMLESPAYRALSLSGHRFLARLEIELGSHAGKDNGKLPATFEQLVEYGVHRQAIAPAIREVVALGFVEITQEGRAGNAVWRRPSLYRLTYRHTDLAAPTDDWKKIGTTEQAEFIAEAARKASKKQKSSVGNRTKGRYGNRTSNGHFHSTETNTTSHSTETHTTSISREGMGGVGPPSAMLTIGQAREGGLAQVGDVAKVIVLASEKNRPPKKTAVRS